LSDFPHLQNIASKLPQYMPELEVGLLIGSNVPRALEPLEVFPAQGDGPYAVRMRHGWTIHGPLKVEHDGVSVGRVSACEVAKETVTPLNAVKMLCESEFVGDESYPGEKGLSVEDRRFMNTVESGIHEGKDGHFVVPLPFKAEDVHRRGLLRHQSRDLLRRGHHSPFYHR